MARGAVWRFPALLAASLATIVIMVPRPALASEADEMTAVRRVLEAFRDMQDSGDMAEQERLMTPDRVWIGPDGTRRTDNVQNMRFQAAEAAVQKQAVPGLRRFSFDRDYLIRLMGGGTVALASFYRTAMIVHPAGTPEDLRKEYASYKVTGTVVLEKRGGEWKIVHTHWSGAE